MSIKYTILIGIVSSQMLACSQFSHKRSIDTAQLQELLSSHKYQQARKAIQEVPQQSPLLSTVQKHEWQYERDTIKKAVHYEQKQQWQDARQTLQSGLKVLPSSQILLAAHQQFQQRFEVKKTTLRIELLLNEGELLLKNARTYQQIKNINPSNILTNLEINAHKTKQHRVAKQLFMYSQYAKQQDDYYLARRCLQVAGRLQPATERFQKELQVVKNHLRVIEQPKVVVGQTNTTIYNKLVSTYKTLLEQDDLLAAQRKMHVIQARYTGTKEIADLALELEVLVNARVSAATERGREHYSEGQVEKALQIWEGILPLDPSNAELKSSILRAQRVLNNLRMLSNKNAS